MKKLSILLILTLSLFALSTMVFAEDVIEIPFAYFEIDNAEIVLDEESSIGVVVWVNSFDFDSKKTISLEAGSYSVQVWMRVHSDWLEPLGGRPFADSDAIELTAEGAHVRTFHNSDYDGTYGAGLDRVLNFSIEEDTDVLLNVYATNNMGMLLDKVVIVKQ